MLSIMSMLVCVIAAGFEDKTAYAQCIFAYTPGNLTLVPG